MTSAINKTMSRQDLLTEEAQPVIRDLNALVHAMYARGLYMSSWVGTLPWRSGPGKRSQISRLLSGIKGRLSGKRPGNAEAEALRNGMEQRLEYQALPDAADDLRLPWFLYWEIYWLIKVAGPSLHKGMRVLDGGGTMSLFSCYLASLGFEVHAVDLKANLRDYGMKVARTMGWPMFSYVMDLQALEFPDAYFDHAFSVCVFEHLNFETRQKTLAEVARCLKSGGILGITFDYRNPAPGIVGYGKDTRPENRLSTLEDIARNFSSNPQLEIIGNGRFYDNGESYLAHHRFDHTPYTFGALFLRKKGVQ